MNKEEQNQTANDDKKNESNLSSALNDAIKALMNASVKDIVAFTKALAKEADIDLNAMAAPQQSAAKEEKEEKTSFNVTLDSFGESKVPVIRVVKDLLGLGLMEANNLVSSAPKILKEDVSKAQAEEMKSKIEAAGGKVSLS